MQKQLFKGTYAHYDPCGEEYQNSFQNENYIRNFDDEKLTNHGKNRHSNQSSLEEIDNTISWRESQTSSRYANNESEEVKFLKEKLIETHSKLLKELENSNRLVGQTHKLEKELQVSQRNNKELEEKVDELEKEIDYAHKQVCHFEKNELKYKSVEHKYEEESKRNCQLKEDMESMRRKMLEAITNKNNFEEGNLKMKCELRAIEQEKKHLTDEIMANNTLMNKMQREIDSYKNINYQLKQQVIGLENELEDLRVNFEEQKELVEEMEKEQQKVYNLDQETEELKRELVEWKNKAKQMEKEAEKNREELLRIDTRKDIMNKDLVDQIKHLSQELEDVKLIQQESEREIGFLRNKPIHEAEKKKRHLQITKELVNQLESEQQMYENIGSQGVSHPTLRNIPLVNQRDQEMNLNIKHAELQEVKNVSNKNNCIENYRLEEAGELEAVLFNCNLERKKIKVEIERIEENKIKTREMIVKKRRLDEELEYQEEKIKKVKEELRRLRMA